MASAACGPPRSTFPLRDTLALSEHLLGITVFAAPVVWLTGNAVLAQNLALFASYVLAGAGMYLLARSLWGRKDAAFIAAVAFAFAPHRVMHVPHLQVLMSGWMPVSLWGLHRYFATGSRRSLAVFAGAFAVLGLSNGYFLYFFSIPAALIVACELASARPGGSGPRRFRVPWREAAGLAAAAAAACSPPSLRRRSPTFACARPSGSGARSGRCRPSAPPGPITSASRTDCGRGPES